MEEVLWLLNRKLSLTPPLFVGNFRVDWAGSFLKAPAIMANTHLTRTGLIWLLFQRCRYLMCQWDANNVFAIWMNGEKRERCLHSQKTHGNYLEELVYADIFPVFAIGYEAFSFIFQQRVEKMLWIRRPLTYWPTWETLNRRFVWDGDDEWSRFHFSCSVNQRAGSKGSSNAAEEIRVGRTPAAFSPRRGGYVLLLFACLSGGYFKTV